MGFQPEGNVERLTRERFAGEDLPFYRIIKQSAEAENEVLLCDADEMPIAVTIPSTDQYRWDATAGAMVLREEYKEGEIPEAVTEGIAYVELGETVVAGEICVPGANGVGMAYADALSSLTAAELATKVGVYIDGGDSEDLVRVKLGGV